MPTRDEIEAAKTPAGGWTRDQLAAWGVPWPPPKGWRKEIETEGDGPDSFEDDWHWRNR